jgi:hypothetical protein
MILVELKIKVLSNDFHQEITDIMRIQRYVTEFFSWPIQILPTGSTPDFVESEWNRNPISVAIAAYFYANSKSTIHWKRSTVLNSEYSRGRTM